MVKDKEIDDDFLDSNIDGSSKSWGFEEESDDSEDEVNLDYNNNTKVEEEQKEEIADDFDEEEEKEEVKDELETPFDEPEEEKPKKKAKKAKESKKEAVFEAKEEIKPEVKEEIKEETAPEKEVIMSAEPKEEIKDTFADNTEDDKKDTKRLVYVIGAVILCFAVILGFMFMNKSNDDRIITIDDLHAQNAAGTLDPNLGYMYNGFSFVRQQNLWYTQVQSKINNTVFDVPLHYGPKELEEIPVVGSLDKTFISKDVYITFDPTSLDMQYIALAAAELSLSFVKGIGVVPKAACTSKETDACSDRPIIDCNSGKPTIYIKQSEANMVRLLGNCAVVQGSKENIVKSADKFLLMQYGIMK